MMIHKIIGGFVTLFVGLSIYPVMKEEIFKAIAESGQQLPQYQLIMLNYIPYFFVGTTILMFASSFIDYRMEDVEEEIREQYQPNKKQTYEEYVAERLRVERMMRYGWIGRWI